jgi:predicted phage tail protein
VSVQALREVRLYGVLGKRFGRVHYLAIGSPAEAVRALCCTIDGFREFLINEAGYAYKVIVGASARIASQLHDPFGIKEVIKLVPIVGGAKRAGIFQTIIGAVIFAVSFVTGFVPGMQIGLSLMFSGVVQMLSPQRKAKQDALDGGDQAKGYAFDGPVNTSQQGLPVPLVIGRVFTGSAVISAGLTIDDILIAPVAAPAPAPLPSIPLPPEQPLYIPYESTR